MAEQHIIWQFLSAVEIKVLMSVHVRYAYIMTIWLGLMLLTIDDVYVLF
jgi:hypothetical protein